jgi:hypothetical protein
MLVLAGSGVPPMTAARGAHAAVHAALTPNAAARHPNGYDQKYMLPELNTEPCLSPFSGLL